MSTPVQLKCGVIELLPSGIIKVIYKDSFQLELADVLEVEEVFLNLAEANDIYCVTVTTDGPLSFTEEAMDFLAVKAQSTIKIKGSAIVLKSLANRITARVFIRFHQPIYPTKIFSTEDKATNWLSSLMPVK
jgi:hypothetical protein